METFAYLHLALAYEDSTDTKAILEFENLKLFEGINHQKLSSKAWIYLLSLFTTLVMLSVATQTLAALKVGDRSGDVYNLQDRLQRLQYLKSRPTGYYGELTRQAVKRFQHDNELPPTGIADSQTLDAIRARLNNVRQQRARQNSGLANIRGELRRGDSGETVKNVQRRLRTLGYYSGSIDGVYGSETEAAVKRFQRSRRIVDNGIVGPQTRGALIAANSGSARSTDSGKHYMVVVPDRGESTLEQVRRDSPNAFRGRSGLGRYINAGKFSNRSNAESLTEKLRSRGLDARVVFQ